MVLLAGLTAACTTQPDPGVTPQQPKGGNPAPPPPGVSQQNNANSPNDQAAAALTESREKFPGIAENAKLSGDAKTAIDKAYAKAIETISGPTPKVEKLAAFDELVELVNNTAAENAGVKELAADLEKQKKDFENAPEPPQDPNAPQDLNRVDDPNAAAPGEDAPPPADAPAAGAPPAGEAPPAADKK